MCEPCAGFYDGSRASETLSVPRQEKRVGAHSMHLVDASASCLHVHSRFELSERAHALTVAKTGRKAQKGEQKGELALYGYLSKLWRKV